MNTYVLRVLDGNGAFRRSLYCDDNTPSVMKAIDWEIQCSISGFRPDRQNFIPAEYQTAQVEIIEIISGVQVGQWGRYTGLKMFEISGAK